MKLSTKYLDYGSIKDLEHIFQTLDRKHVNIKEYKMLLEYNPDLVKNMTPVYRSIQIKKIGPPKEVLIGYNNPTETFREL